MKIAKQILAAFTVMAIIASGCGSSPSSRSGSSSGPDELDAAIRDASDYLNDNIPAGSKIVILNIQSDYPALSDYIIDELIANAVNDRVFSVVDRQQLDAIRSEQNFQWSGEVDDNSAMEIGKFFGAQTIISGAMSPLGERYRLRVRALEVQTAQVQGQYNRNMAAGPTINDLVKSGGSTRTAAAPTGSTASSAPATSGTGSQTAQPATPAQPAAPALPAYRVGDTGPAGGLIFYDKGNNRGGWRYLEAAPADLPGQFRWTTERINVNDLDRAVGRGKSNTQAIMEEAARRGGGFGWAAQACDAFTLNDFDDWFLPSRDELHYMYGNLHMKGLGNFREDYYWSSTGDGYSAWLEHFSNGSQDTGSNPHRVRPIRQVAGPGGTAQSSVDTNGGIAGASSATGTTTTAAKPKKSGIGILSTIFGILLVGGVIAWVIISPPSPDAVPAR